MSQLQHISLTITLICSPVYWTQVWKKAEVLGTTVTNVSQQFGFSMNKVTIV